MPVELKDGQPTLYAKDAATWRAWLQKNALTQKSIWLIIYRKESATPSVYYDEAVDQALCYGWIDSKPNKRDEHSFYQFFAKRNPKSNWSRVNKEKVERLMETGQMAEQGLAMVAEAKARGTWDALNDVENGVIPSDLEAAFSSFPNSKANFEAFPRSVRRGILEWIFNAKKPETRAKRINDTAKLAAEKIRANQYRP